MQEKLNKIIWGSVIVLIIVLLLILIFDKKEKEYTSNIFYMDTYIYVKIVSDNEKKANEVLSNVENIYKTYHELSDKYKAYDGVKNLYYLNYNNEISEYIEIDKKLYDLIQFGIDAYNKSNGLIDISIGNVLDIWKSYRTSEYGVPTLEELQAVKTDSIKDIILKDGKIKNNHVNIDLGALAKGYTTEKVKEYFKEEGITNYIVNAGGNVIVGENFDNTKFSIGLEDPDDPTGIYKVIYGKNISIVTSGGYNRYYEWNGEKYNHIISPNTLFPTNYMKSVSILADNSSYGDMLSTMLFLMDIEDGLEYVNNTDGIEAIWYTNDNQIITSNGIKEYEQK